MTAPLGNAQNVYTGTRELGQVTNTYAGYIQSVGAAYNLVLPWQPDKLEWYNYTKFGTNTSNIQGVWFRDMPAGDAVILTRGTTTLTSTLETTNGVTIATLPGGYADQHNVVTGITTATPGVVTTASNHGLATNDRVIFTKLAGAVGQQLNGNTYVVNVLSATTFSLYDIHGFPVPVAGTYTSGGQITLTGPDLGVVNNPPTYQLALGTAVMGANNDIIYVVATKFNAYFNLGVA